MRACRHVLTAFAIALVLTVGIPSVASAAVFFCGSGDVFCVIGSIRSANEGRGADTIILQAGTYTFTAVDNAVDSGSSGGNALPSITGRVTIRGAGADATILDGGGLVRLLHIAATGRVTVQGVTLQQGDVPINVGGVLFNRGTLTITESVIRNDRSDPGGIYNLGTLRLVDSQSLGRFGLGIGGGILSSGVLHVVRSTIEHAGGGFLGIGIQATGAVTIKDSTILDNSRVLFGEGGLIVGGTVSITNTTILSNGPLRMAAGGGTATVTNVTIFDEGGSGLAVGAGSTVALQNTIVVQNSFNPLVGGECSGTIVSLGSNIFDHLLATLLGCPIDLAPSDVVVGVGDAGLGTFQDDGVPGHGHFPLTPLSPAINSANPEACPARDQLGTSRHRRRGCDIGAVEFQP
jgi:hypothetical protein